MLGRKADTVFVGEGELWGIYWSIRLIIAKYCGFGCLLTISNISNPPEPAPLAASN